MKCINCGKEISDESRFCMYCGKEQIIEKVEEQKTDIAEDKTTETAQEEGDCLKTADNWTKAIYYALFSVCSIALVLIVGLSIYYFISPESSHSDIQTAAVDSINVDSIELDSLPVDEPAPIATNKSTVILDSIETADETSLPETEEVEEKEPVIDEPVVEENKNEEVNSPE